MRTLILIASLTVAAAAMATAAGEDVTFFVESIGVEGLQRAPARVVIAESRLTPGRIYSERDIRMAAARVGRLPFIVHAEAVLAKGSARGRFVVTLRVDEVEPLFFDYRSTFRVVPVQRQQPALRPDGTSGASLLRLHRELPTVGGRLFAGGRTMVAVSAELGGGEPCCEGEPQYSLAVTHYDVFGTTASLAAVVQYREYSLDLTQVPDLGGRTTTSFGDHLSWGLTAALPVARNQTVYLDWHRAQTHMIESAAGENRLVRRSLHDVQGAWRLDTTNDLLFPDTGGLVEGGAIFRRHPRLREAAGGAVAVDEWQHALTLQGKKYWPVTARQSLSVGGRVSGDAEFQSGVLLGGYSANLFRRQVRDRARLRLDLSGGIALGTGSRPSAQLAAALALRSRWGIARVDFTYYGWRPR
jgi:outer membrane protein assembly factor BamA